MTSDDNPEPEQRGLQTAWARVLEGVLLRRAADGPPSPPPGPDERDSSQADLPRRARELSKKRFRSVAMPSMPDLTWRDWFLFGCTGASIVLALVTFGIVLSDVLARGTP